MTASTGQLPSRYTERGEIARGGMGRVVEATDTVLDRVVAVKEALAKGPEALRRFARETRITARLEHPSIVPVYDAGVGPDGSPFYVMRKVTGRPLERLVREARTLDERLALLPNIVAAANALAHAHRRGVIHRDIKPGNILVGELGETIVIDWGLAKVVDEIDDADLPIRIIAPGAPVSTTSAERLESDELKTRAGVVFGTVGFMAPEQLHGAEPTPRFDVYALGATLYYVISGRPPHHAAASADMIEAAVAGPPARLGSLVAGVPAELSTIVDKALAFDHRERYPDAAALAEDLRRFLTGQLVASHRYTPRQRLARFVRQHRASVIVASVAAVALVAGGVIAVRSVLAERDRANGERRIALDEKREAEAARTREAARADELTLHQARQLLESNPTAAVALLKPLAGGHWRAARAIGAGARAAGVAWAIPVSPTTLSLEMSRDGLRALATGGDGALYTIDLAARTARAIARFDHARFATFFDGDRRIAAYEGKHLAIVEVASGSRRDVELDVEIAGVASAGDAIVWVDAARKAWQLGAAGASPIPISLAVPACAAPPYPSPDGRWLAIVSERGVRVLDRQHADAPPATVPIGVACGNVVWAADSGSLAVMRTHDQVVAYSAPAFHEAAIESVKQVPLDVGIRVFAAAPTERAMLELAYGVQIARGDAIVSAEHGIVQVRSDDGDVPIHPPKRVDAVVASPASPYVVGAIDGALAIWNLDDSMARRFAVEAPDRVAWVGRRQLLAIDHAGRGHWLDLRAGDDVAADVPAGAEIIAPADGDLALAVIANGDATLLRRRGNSTVVGSAVVAADFLDRDRLVYGNHAGEIWLVGTAPTSGTGKPTRLAAGGTALAGLEASRDARWVAAVYVDGTLWRYDVATGQAQVLAAPAEDVAKTVAIHKDCVLFADRERIKCWAATGLVTTAMTLQQPVTTLVRLGDDRLIATSRRNAAFLIDLTDADNPVTTALEANVDVTPSDALIQIVRSGTDIAAIDLATNIQWTVARPGDRTWGEPTLAPDGIHVAAAGQQGVLVWSTELPATADATARWLDAMTNAVAVTGPRGTTLTWR